MGCDGMCGMWGGVGCGYDRVMWTVHKTPTAVSLLACFLAPQQRSPPEGVGGAYTQLGKCIHCFPLPCQWCML